MKDEIDNLQGADHFIHALIMGQKIWPNLYGQSVSEAAFVVHEERLKAQQEINRLQEEVRQLRTYLIPLSPCPETKDVEVCEQTPLKPCPFCGNEATRLNKEYLPYSDSRGHVRCTNCPSEMNAINQETADAWWNAEHDR